MKTCIFVPHNFFMSFEAVKCWLNIPKLPDISYAHFESPYIDTARSDAVEIARASGDDLLMIDSDMLFTPNDIMKMRNHLRLGTEIMSGVYPVEMNGQKMPALYRLNKEGTYNPQEVEDGINETDACGAGFLGISKEVIAKLPKDSFARLKKDDLVFGEDISFCRLVKSLGMKVFYDSTIRLAQVRTGKMELSTS